MLLHEHSLFPLTGEPGPRASCEITGIKITRSDEAGPVFHPHEFDPTDLVSEEDIYQRFGGGLYEVIAYGTIPNQKGHNLRGILDRRKVPIAGESRPFLGGSKVKAPEVQAPQVTESSFLEKVQAAGAVLMPALAMMFERADAARAREDKRSQEMLQLMMQQQQSNMQLMTAMITQSNQGSSLVDAFRSGLDLGTKNIRDTLEAAAANEPVPEEQDELGNMLEIVNKTGETFEKIRGFVEPNHAIEKKALEAPKEPPQEPSAN